MSKLPEVEHVIVWTTIGFFSFWGGLTRYIIDYKRYRFNWSWYEALCQVVISGFTGALGGLISFEAGVSLNMTFIMSGVSSAMGTVALRIIARKFFK